MWYGLHNYSYAYNGFGTELVFGGLPHHPATLGLGVLASGNTPAPEWYANTPVPESRVLVPSDLIAVGDGTIYRITGFGYPNGADWFSVHENGASNGLFCDGHVETSNPARIPMESFGNGGSIMKADANLAKRWNNDNEPHPETWVHP